MKKKIILPVGLAAGCLLFFVANSTTDQKKVQELKASVQSVHGMYKVNLSREQTRQKVVQIINRFNPDMDAAMKHAIAEEIFQMSIKYPNLDVDLICATITHESAHTWNPRIVSNAGALGLMQIMPGTGRWLAKYEGITWSTDAAILFDPIYNIRLGSRYLSALIENYDLVGGLAAYNGGAKRVELWLANNKADGILWTETENYVPFVLKLYDEYKML